MSFNTTSGIYYYSRNFSDLSVKSYAQSYNVSCLGNPLGFEDLNLSSSVTVWLNHTFLTSSLTLEPPESVVLEDLSNDTKIDVILGGHNNSVRILKVYIGNGSVFTFNESLDGYGVIDGSMGLVDYNKDGDFDIGQTGQGNDQEARIFKKD